MRGKLFFVAGAALGYVLGARAGRKRYEQIKAAVESVWESPAVQRQTHAATDYLAAKAAELPGVAVVTIRKLFFAPRSSPAPEKQPYPTATPAPETTVSNEGR